MSEIKAISPRASYLQKEDEKSLVISAAADKSRSNFIGAILLLWLAGGAYIIYSYFGLTDQKAKIMTLVWIAFWAYFAYIMGKAFMWQRSGREILKVKNGKLYYKHDTGGRGWVQEYPLGEIKNAKINTEKNSGLLKRLGGDYWNTDCDSIRFEYKDKEIAVGYKLNEQESARVLKLLKN
jgi:hypothetical protein